MPLTLAGTGLVQGRAIVVMSDLDELLVWGRGCDLSYHGDALDMARDEVAITVGKLLPRSRWW